MNKRRVEARLTEMVGAKVYIGVYSNIEDIFEERPRKVDTGKTKQVPYTIRVPVFGKGGKPLIGADGKQVMKAEERTKTIPIYELQMESVKVGERRHYHGEQYAYSIEVDAKDKEGKPIKKLVQKFCTPEQIAEATEWCKKHPAPDNKPEPSELDILLEAMRAKLTPGEIQAARIRLQA